MECNVNEVIYYHNQKIEIDENTVLSDFLLCQAPRNESCMCKSCYKIKIRYEVYEVSEVYKENNKDTP
jgi:hypothetical protein